MPRSVDPQLVTSPPNWLGDQKRVCWSLSLLPTNAASSCSSGSASELNIMNAARVISARVGLLLVIPLTVLVRKSQFSLGESSTETTARHTVARSPSASVNRKIALIIHLKAKSLAVCL